MREAVAGVVRGVLADGSFWVILGHRRGGRDGRDGEHGGLRGRRLLGRLGHGGPPLWDRCEGWTTRTANGCARDWTRAGERVDRRGIVSGRRATPTGKSYPNKIRTCTEKVVIVAFFW